jgi:OmcA/MtrC family decaheme c-type cytochrome
VSNDKCNACHVELGFHSNRNRLGVDYCASCHKPNFNGNLRIQGANLGPEYVDVFPDNAQGFVSEPVDIGAMSHRIHAGSELPSVANEGGVMLLGGNGGEFSDLSAFAMPPANSVENCTTCHEAGTWGLPVNREPIRRTVLECAPAGTGAAVCPPGATSRIVDTSFGAPTATAGVFTGVLVIPRATAVCTSCHDGEATKAHARLNTVDPDGSLSVARTAVMSQYNYNGDEIETCATCHGEGREWDPLVVHPGVTP